MVFVGYCYHCPVTHEPYLRMRRWHSMDQNVDPVVTSLMDLARMLVTPLIPTIMAMQVVEMK